MSLVDLRDSNGELWTDAESILIFIGERKQIEQRDCLADRASVSHFFVLRRRDNVVVYHERSYA